MQPLNARVLQRSDTLCNNSYEEHFIQKSAAASKRDGPGICSNLNNSYRPSNTATKLVKPHRQSLPFPTHHSSMSDSHEWDVDSESTEAEDLDSRIYFTAKTRVMPLCSASDASRTRLVAVVAPPAKTMHPELASTLSTTTLIATTPPVQDTVKDHGMHEDTTNTIDTDERPERALQHIRRTCNVRDWFRRNGVSDNEFEWAKATCGRVAVAVARVVVCLAAAVSVGDVVAAEGVTEPGPNAL